MYRELSLVMVNSGWWRSFLRRVVAVFFIGLLASCTENTVPANAVLDITPRSHSVEITEWLDESGGCIYASENFMDIPLVLQLTTVNGSPIGQSPIFVYADFAENTYPGYPVLGLYEDLNSNGVIDSETELISGFDDNIAQVRTGKFTGAKTLLLRVNLSCSFRGEVRAIAGGISGAAVIEVNGSAFASASANASANANANANAVGFGAVVDISLEFGQAL